MNNNLQQLGRLAQNSLNIMEQIDALKAEKKKLSLFDIKRKEIKQRIRELERLEDQSFRDLERFSILQM